MDGPGVGAGGATWPDFLLVSHTWGGIISRGWSPYRLRDRPGFATGEIRVRLGLDDRYNFDIDHLGGWFIIVLKQFSHDRLFFFRLNLHFGFRFNLGFSLTFRFWSCFLLGCFSGLIFHHLGIRGGHITPRLSGRVFQPLFPIEIEPGTRFRFTGRWIRDVSLRCWRSFGWLCLSRLLVKHK
jgi:hypothetical protein